MPSERSRIALFDMRDNIMLARLFMGARSVEEFKADRMCFYAVTRALEILSEAARKLPEDMRARHPHLPWRAIMGAGNVYRHDYDNVAEEFVWRTVQTGLDSLLLMVETELTAQQRG